MKEYIARCTEKGYIVVKIPNGTTYEIHDKEVAISFANSILSVIDKAWPDESENEFNMNDKDYIAVASEYNFQCDKCAFFGNYDNCENSMECEAHKRNDRRSIYWKVKE